MGRYNPRKGAVNGENDSSKRVPGSPLVGRKTWRNLFHLRYNTPMNDTLTATVRANLGKIIQPGYPEKRISLRKVASISGVSAPTISRFLRGATVDSDSLDRLVEFMGGVSIGQTENQKNSGMDIQQDGLN